MGLMGTCKEIAFLFSKELDTSLSPITKMKMRLHLMMCKKCTAYKSQLVFADTLLKIYYKTESDEELSFDAQSRMQKALDDIIEQE